DKKVVLLGSSDVGKTAIVTRYAEGIFPTRPIPTIGSNFLSKRLNIEGTNMRFQLWDTAGQDRFRSLMPMYYRGAHVAVIVYDVTSINSFDKVKEWVQELRSNTLEDIVLVLCGNKIDLVDERRVERKVAQSFADQINAMYYETSARKNIGIDHMFMDVATKLLLLHHNLVIPKVITPDNKQS
ncbi:hypothetical protein SAMD00019534_081060, partial [Acytostelium subglobosum LB1]|uniref:hypothetical protein n=1 Tax=Acytostelium subglobosum LB1 TaxID=1410327 RepID=UPI000645052C